jgi:hypothetical protein
MQSRLSAAAGGLLLTGTASWAVTFSLWPSDAKHNSRLEIAGGLAFQIGLVAYVALLAATRAAGDRWGQRILASETAVLALAIAWSVGILIQPSTHESPLLLALDAAWPLSMLGLFVIALAVLRAGRFHGMNRFAPLVASLWLVADGVGFAVGAARPIHIAWLAVSYGWLSAVLIREDLAIPSLGPTFARSV